ncbi:MAG: hypothetical protein AB1938_31865 [Myxococcota bacterium]
MTNIHKLHPRPSITSRLQERKQAKAPEAKKPDVARAALDKQVGRTSSFSAFKLPRVQLRHDFRNPDATSSGRRDAGGTADDSIGRNRGTPDDSIGGDEALKRGVSSTSVGVTKGREVPPSAREGLSAETQAKMEALLERRHGTKAVNASFVMGDKAFSKLSVEDRTKLVDLLAAGGPRSARAVAELFETGRAARLTSPASDGTSMLDSLVRIAHSEDKKSLAPVLFDIARPSRIWQGRAPTCTVSTMQYELARQQPAEYARLMAGLICDGEVKMKGGGVLRAESNALAASRENRDLRSRSEAIFQTAAMEYANGLDNYQALEQRTDKLFFGEDYRGLFPGQIRNMVGQLFGVSYKTREIANDAQAREELGQILARERPNRPVIFDISMGPKSNHLVALEGIRGDKVYFRDPTTGDVRSMSKEKFVKKLVAVHYADEPAPKRLVTPFAAAKYGISSAVGLVQDAASSVANFVGKWF